MNSVRRKSRGPVRGDQRKNRSEAPIEAARLYLEAVADRCDASALALATKDGLLIAGTRGKYDLQSLAAIGASCVRGEGDSDALGKMMDDVAGGEDLYATGVTIADVDFCLTSVGARVRSVKDATVALSRILSPALQFADASCAS